MGHSLVVKPEPLLVDSSSVCEMEASWNGVFLANLAGKVASTPDANALAFYLCAQFVVPIDCHFVAFAQAGEWIDAIAWGKCENRALSSLGEGSLEALVCLAARAADHEAIWEGGSVQVRCVDDQRQLWLAVGVPNGPGRRELADILRRITPLLAFYAQSASTNLRPPRSEPILKSPNPLTERQLTIIRLLSEGRTNDAIARRISFSTSLVRHELMTIFKSLEVRSRTDAVVAARRAGILELCAS